MRTLHFRSQLHVDQFYGVLAYCFLSQLKTHPPIPHPTPTHSPLHPNLLHATHTHTHRDTHTHRHTHTHTHTHKQAKVKQI